MTCGSITTNQWKRTKDLETIAAGRFGRPTSLTARVGPMIAVGHPFVRRARKRRERRIDIHAKVITPDLGMRRGSAFMVINLVL